MGFEQTALQQQIFRLLMIKQTHLHCRQMENCVAVLIESTQASYVKFVLARYMQNGILDSTFGTNGQLTTDFGGRP